MNVMENSGFTADKNSVQHATGKLKRVDVPILLLVEFETFLCTGWGGDLRTIAFAICS